jgi:hypothetical protein
MWEGDSSQAVVELTIGAGRGGWAYPNVLAAALANKLARIAWTVLAQARSYQARVTKAAA